MPDTLATIESSMDRLLPKLRDLDEKLIRFIASGQEAIRILDRVIVKRLGPIHFRIGTARTANRHGKSRVVYAQVPRPDGLLPTHWPAGMDRRCLRRLPGRRIDKLLGEYELATEGTVMERRNRLTAHIGAIPFRR